MIYSQTTISVAIPWNGDKTKASLYDDINVDVPAFPYSENELGEICFIYRQEQTAATKSRWKADVTSIQTSPASAFDQQYVLNNNLNYTSSLSYKMKVNRAREEEYLSFEIAPYILQNGQLMRVTNVDFNLTNLGAIPIVDKLKSYAASSVLQSGSWYKITITKSGVYKVDKDFLTQLGISGTVNSNQLNIYGNGQGMLSIYNSDYHPDDLVKNAILMNDGGDNSFDDGDYILFYANGPDAQTYSPGYGLLVTKNLYNTTSTYFLHVDGTDSPLRVSNASLSPNPVTNTVTTSNNVASHEEDLSNFVKSGQRWYGENFDNTLEYSFPFTLPDITSSSPLQLYCSYANTGNGAGSNFTVYVNGTLLQTNGCSNASGDVVAIRSSNIGNINVSNSSSVVKIDLNRINPSVQGWLDKLELNYTRILNYPNRQIDFRNFASIGTGNVTQFVIGNVSSNVIFWEITDPTKPKNINGSLVGSTYSFNVATDTLRQFVTFKTNDAFTPTAGGHVSNQNLHGLGFADLLIVAHPDFLDQANRLAALHQAQGMSVNVVNVYQVYNEFSSGMVDPVAIRWFTKMFYDRAAGNLPDMPKYLCLFGDGTYDPKNRLPNNDYLIPTYQVEESENSVTSFVSDDFYGLLDNSESFSDVDLVDVGIGRIVSSTPQEAVDMVNKIEHYMKNGSSLFPNQSGIDVNTNGYSSTFGDWRLWVTQIADDEESGQFVIDQENYYTEYSNAHPILNGDKIYLDAYKQIAVVGGQRYPDVPPAIDNRIDQGTLIMNYVGHGGETGLALERIITIPQIEAWKNINKLPLFVSATCEFTRYDDPSRVSAGELMYLSNVGGAISLMTTTRPVLITENSVVGARLYDYIFNRGADGKPLPMGEIMRLTKNASISGGGAAKRIFTLIGDPALPLATPPLRIAIDSVNGVSPNILSDTLKSLSKVTIKAHIEDTLGNLISGFNGVAFPSVFDKPQTYKTLGQDPTSPIMSFQIQKNYLYKGKSTVANGRFEFSFIVPKDIDFNYGSGKISTYANSSSTDADGVEKRVIIGGVDPNGIVDNTGPTIKLYMNDVSFVNGGLTDENPVFLAQLFDENGINTVGSGIGHDITAILDANTTNPIILNDFYTADLDTYKSGKVRYPMYSLTPGTHTINLKVWDVNNNSSDAQIEFTVVQNKSVAISHVLNYPNPFTTHTEFFFEHNQIDVSLQVQIQIMTITGKLIKTINQLVNTVGFRSEGIPWDGRDDFGDQLARGVYVYKLTVTAPDGSSANKIEKLMLLK